MGKHRDVIKVWGTLKSAELNANVKTQSLLDSQKKNLNLSNLSFLVSKPES